MYLVFDTDTVCLYSSIFGDSYGCFADGRKRFSYQGRCDDVFLQPINMTEGKELFAYSWVLGCITLVALNQMLLTLQMLFTPVVGYLTYIATIIMSAFYFTKYLPGNSLMLLRTALFDERGVNFGWGVVYAGILWFIFFSLGAIFMKKKDVLG